MTKFTTNNSGYRRFGSPAGAITTSISTSLTTSIDDTVETELSHRTAAPGILKSYVWDSAVARKTQAKGFYRRLIKPAMDCLFVILTLPFSVPVIALCALVLWCEGGSPFYRQDRLGRNGKRFSILKLRTMVPNADVVLEKYLAANPARRREWDDLQKLRDDPRVTRVGQFLRTTSLDELPQLFNVLKGDMSLVGPRPMMPEQLTMYGEPRAYFAVRPGITGLWQVSTRNTAKFSFRNDVDRDYEGKLSLRMDIKILFKTVDVVLRPTGH